MTELPPSGSVTDALQVHVARIIGTAEQAAIELQREVELEAGRRAAAIRAMAQEDADRIRAEAEAQAQAYLDTMRLRVDAFATGRVQRISELTDTLLAKGDAIQARLDDVVSLQTQLGDLLSALSGAARAAAAESTQPGPRLPRVETGGPQAPSDAHRDPSDAGGHVQRIAQDLPRSPRPTSPSEDRSA